ncbi:MAG: hypothetical protein IT427_20260 [Pirellulales bacterium]|nr:hypothetical protein [Pirellulales bacterium]
MLRRLFLAACVFVLVTPAIVSAVDIDTIWNGGVGNWNTATNWTPNVVPNNSGEDTYSVFIDGSKLGASTVTMNANLTINALTIDLGDSLTVQNSRTLAVVNAITNNGLLEIASVGNNTIVQVGPATTLTGNGQVLMVDHGMSRLGEQSACVPHRTMVPAARKSAPLPPAGLRPPIRS